MQDTVLVKLNYKVEFKDSLTRDRWLGKYFPEREIASEDLGVYKVYAGKLSVWVNTVYVYENIIVCGLCRINDTCSCVEV